MTQSKRLERRLDRDFPHGDFGLDPFQLRVYRARCAHLNTVRINEEAIKRASAVVRGPRDCVTYIMGEDFRENA